MKYVKLGLQGFSIKITNVQYALNCPPTCIYWNFMFPVCALNTISSTKIFIHSLMILYRFRVRTQLYFKKNEKFRRVLHADRSGFVTEETDIFNVTSRIRVTYVSLLISERYARGWNKTYHQRDETRLTETRETSVS